MYQRMEGVPGFPKIYGYESQETASVLVMELLGRSFSDLFVSQGKQFSLKTCLLLGMGCVKRIADMHGRGLLHRDIKPANFCSGQTTNEEEVYCLDLGLAKPYMTADGEHIPRIKKQSLVGTAEFASLNNHHEYELSRRDDLEAIAYMLIYLLKGSLPWMECMGKDNKEKNAAILQSKMRNPPHILCKKMPSPFMAFLIYSQNLQYEETPDYEFCYGLFKDLYVQRDLDRKIPWRWDWDRGTAREEQNRKKVENNQRRISYAKTSPNLAIATQQLGGSLGRPRGSTIPGAGASTGTGSPKANSRHPSHGGDDHSKPKRHHSKGGASHSKEEQELQEPKHARESHSQPRRRSTKLNALGLPIMDDYDPLKAKQEGQLENFLSDLVGEFTESQDSPGDINTEPETAAQTPVAAGNRQQKQWQDDKKRSTSVLSRWFSCFARLFCKPSQICVKEVDENEKAPGQGAEDGHAVLSRKKSRRRSSEHTAHLEQDSDYIEMRKQLENALESRSEGDEEKYVAQGRAIHRASSLEENFVHFDDQLHSQHSDSKKKHLKRADSRARDLAVQLLNGEVDESLDEDEVLRASLVRERGTTNALQEVMEKALLDVGI